MTLLDDGAWQGKIWTGSWTDGSGGTYDAVEPATGEVLGAGRQGDAGGRAHRRRARRRGPAVLGRTAVRGAGRACCAEPATLLVANAEEIKGWLARESGAIQPFGDFQVHTSAARSATRRPRCLAPVRRAAARRRAAAVLGPPRAGRRRRRDRAVQRADRSWPSARWPRRWRSATP